VEPEHYTKYGVYDPLKIIKTYLSKEELYGFFYASAITHLLRHQAKGNPVGDLEKAKTFIDWLQDEFKIDELDVVAVADEAEGEVKVIEHKKD